MPIILHKFIKKISFGFCTMKSKPRPKRYECIVNINNTESGADTEIVVFEKEVIAKLSSADSIRLDALLNLDLEFAAMAQLQKRILASDHRAAIVCEHNNFPRREGIECSIHISRNQDDSQE